MVGFDVLKEVRSHTHGETPMCGSGWSHLPQFSSDKFIASAVGGETQEVRGCHALYRRAHTITSPVLRVIQGATQVEVL
jgi:hypothetical protein